MRGSLAAIPALDGQAHELDVERRAAVGAAVHLLAGRRPLSAALGAVHEAARWAATVLPRLDSRPIYDARRAAKGAGRMIRHLATSLERSNLTIRADQQRRSAAGVAQGWLHCKPNGLGSQELRVDTWREGSPISFWAVEDGAYPPVPTRPSASQLYRSQQVRHSYSHHHSA